MIYMLPKSKISFIKSLHQKKFRKEYKLFIIEGLKSIEEFLKSPFKLQSIYYTPKIKEDLPHFATNIDLFEISEAELLKISTLKTPQHILALVDIPKNNEKITDLSNQFSLVLDNVQDPGNLGTIIRTADWFGIQNIVCSKDTADIYNPKTVQSTMGSLSRVRIWQVELNDFLKNTRLPIFGALLEGQNIYEIQWPKEGLILLGNEGHGISNEHLKYINQPVTIPRFGKAESLNVAISTAVFCSELRRIT